MNSTIDDMQQVSAPDLRKYRTEIPNLYDDADLDVYEFRLLVHYLRVGTCWESIRTTAEKCQMSHPMVIKTRRKLEEKGFIRMETLEGENGKVILITVIDKWAENFEKYSKKGGHTIYQGGHTVYQGGHTVYQGGHTVYLKKEPFKKEPLKNLSREQKNNDDGFGFEETQYEHPRGSGPKNADEAKAMIAKSLAKFESNNNPNAIDPRIMNYLVKVPEHLRELARAFCVCKGRPPSKKEDGYWRGEWQDQYDFGIRPNTIREAVGYMRENRLTVKSPKSVTAIAESQPWTDAPSSSKEGMVKVDGLPYLVPEYVAKQIKSNGSTPITHELPIECRDD